MEPKTPSQHYALALILATTAPDPQRQADYAKLARQMLSDFDSLDGATSGAIQDAVLMCLSILRPSGDTNTGREV